MILDKLLELKGTMSAKSFDDMPNPLDKVFEQGKQEGYVAEIDEAIVLHGKCDEDAHFVFKVITDADSTTKLIAQRGSIKGEDEASIGKRGIVSGRIVALTDIKILCHNQSANDARDLAIKLGKNKLTGQV